jgi:hypothetical protein
MAQIITRHTEDVITRLRLYVTFAVLFADAGRRYSPMRLLSILRKARGLLAALDAVQHTGYGAPALAAAAFRLGAFAPSISRRPSGACIPGPDPAEAARAE